MGNSQAKLCFSDEVNLSHFRLLRVVGRGAFGKVRIVERKDTGLTFALKYIRKEDVVRSESVRNILRERRMLKQLSYQFICNLRYSFQDFEYMYLVVDLMNGGDLRFHISKKAFTEEAVRFWISELGLALRYIHSQGIIHRDVKPDNVLLDAEGHVHLADFNIASDFTPGKLLTSKSGTLAYLAPEVYKGTGYSSGADWWSLGVLFYECIYNKRPFEKKGNESLQTQILKANPKFPITDPPVSVVCMHAISSALEEDPEKRLGCVKGEGFSSFVDNPFFRGIDFESLERKEIEPVFVPSSVKTNFDATYDLEELLLEESPLEARARRMKPREKLKVDASEKEIREDGIYKLIDVQFTTFDYTAAGHERPAPPPAVNRSKETEPHQDASRKLLSRRKNSKSYLMMSSSPPELGEVNLLAPIKSMPRPTQNDQGQNTSGLYPPGFRHQLSIEYQNNTTRIPKLSREVSTQAMPREARSLSELSFGETKSPDISPAESVSRPSSKFSFFGRKKGKSNGSKILERGVLGKEGARVIINSSE
ncbi:hypothetical protein K3495_g7590 [Podosphaera aphanis]|nr:hypothetical protein K3495_g7590 [Podosphaera aphanis]